ncbi:hypothetical protein [Streptomyces sp. NPDC086787]|uniref:hypothetical protein n=1 Tax=Streptomyces sp. NPDC086787 TaxID=3365759 RepID=UPI00381D999A
MIDVATRTLSAAVLRPSTKSVDASVLLARPVTPELMRRRSRLPDHAEHPPVLNQLVPYQATFALCST